MRRRYREGSRGRAAQVGPRLRSSPGELSSPATAGDEAEAAGQGDCVRTPPPGSEPTMESGRKDHLPCGNRGTNTTKKPARGNDWRNSVSLNQLEKNALKHCPEPKLCPRPQVPLPRNFFCLLFVLYFQSSTINSKGGI